MSPIGTIVPGYFAGERNEVAASLCLGRSFAGRMPARRKGGLGPEGRCAAGSPQ